MELKTLKWLISTKAVHDDLPGDAEEHATESCTGYSQLPRVLAVKEADAPPVVPRCSLAARKASQKKSSIDFSPWYYERHRKNPQKCVRQASSLGTKRVILSDRLA